MLQKFLAIALVVLLVTRVLFRPKLRQMGKRLDAFMNLLLAAFLLSYAGQLIYLWTVASNPPSP